MEITQTIPLVEYEETKEFLQNPFFRYLKRNNLEYTIAECLCEQRKLSLECNCTICLLKALVDLKKIQIFFLYIGMFFFLF